jgi:uncharacterized membrane protein YgcG
MAHDGTRTALHLSDTTVVRVNGQTAHAADLRRGQTVRASFSTQDGQEMALTIDAKRKAKARAKSASGSSGTGATTGGSSSGGSSSSSGTNP